MSAQRADYYAIEKRLAAVDDWAGSMDLHVHAREDIAYLLARVRRYEAALRAVVDCDPRLAREVAAEALAGRRMT
jgi:hypothetical protein